MQSSEFSLASWWRGGISLRSYVLHTVGCIFVGTPQALDMPPDFYFMQGDRNVPHPNDYTWERQRELLYVDIVRRRVLGRVANFSMIVAILLLAASMLLHGLTTGVASVASSIWHSSPFGHRKMDASEIGKMSDEDAADHLKDLVKELQELQAGPRTRETQSRMREIDAEVRQIMMTHPNVKVPQGE